MNPQDHIRVKICGIVNIYDGIAASESGADYLGFNFYHPSIRYIKPDDCKQIIQEVKSSFPEMITVGIFVNSPLDEIFSIMETCRIDLAQLSGDEHQNDLIELGERGLKVIRLNNTELYSKIINRYPLRQTPPLWLVDSNTQGSFGGSGVKSNWKTAAWLSEKVPIMLAGGLNPDNVQEAIRGVHPWGVDVASGVESAPGVKSQSLIKDFITKARAVGC